MTATATPANAEAIAEALGRPLEVVRTSVHRPNLRYDVERAENGEERLRALLAPPPRPRRGRRRSCTRGRGARARRSRAPCAGTGSCARALPRGPRAGRAHARPGGVRRRAHSGRRRDDRVRHGHRQGERPSRGARQPPRLARELRADGRPRGAGRPPERHRAASRATRTRRRCGGSRWATCRRPTSCGASTARSATRAGRSTPDALERGASAGRTTRASSSGCSSRPASCGEATTPDGRCGSSSFPSMPERARPSTRCSTATRARRRRGWSASSRSRETTRCRHLQVAEHFGETLDGPCGACDVCAPRATSAGRCDPQRPPRSRTIRRGRSSTPSPG